MTPQQLYPQLQNLPFMSLGQAEVITGLIRQHRYSQCLELGFFHGVSSVYMAGALEDLGAGHLTTVDLTDAKDRSPNIEQLLDKAGLSRFVTPLYAGRSYTWSLLQMLKAGQRFDFVYIDGAHTWDTTGFAFCLVDRMLNPGGMVVFDDLDWTLAKNNLCPTWPEEERQSPQVRQVWEQLVLTHPDYMDFVEELGWGRARKKTDADAARGAPPVRTVVMGPREIARMVRARLRRERQALRDRLPF